MSLARFSQLRRGLSTRLVTALTGMFRALGSWRDPDAERFAVQAVPLLLGAQRTMAALTASWIAEQAGTHTGQPIPPFAVPDGILARPGVAPEVVYRRPFVTVRYRLSQGAALPDAVDSGATRLAEVAEGDLQRAHSEAARSVMRSLPEGAAPTGWLRVLVGAENCALCVIASTQLYSVETLNPLHHNCDCGVALVYANDQPDTAERLGQLYAAVEKLTGQAGGLPERGYRDLLVSMTSEHGELGPMLVRPRDAFTGSDNLPGT